MRKRQWFFLGLLGTVVGLAVRLVRGRRHEGVELGSWEPPAPDGG
jgi:hypothetical protein